jgi:hypothetical protein
LGERILGWWGAHGLWVADEPLRDLLADHTQGATGDVRSADRAAAERTMQAMMTMVRLEITPLEAAFCNEAA